MNSVELQEIESLIAEALDAGVTLYAKDGRLAFRQKNEFPASLKQRVVAKKPQLLRYFALKSREGSSATLVDIPKATATKYLPLSYAQEGLWFIEQLQGSRQYYMPAEFHLRGLIDVSAFRQAVRLVIARHESLRSTFHVDSGSQGRPYIKVQSEFETPFEFFDAGHLGDEKSADIRARLDHFQALAFDLSKDVLIRVLLVSDNDKHWLAFNMHHIVSDGASMANLVKEVAHFYGALVHQDAVSLPPLACQFSDYAQWQKAHFNEAYFERHINYFKRILEDKSPLQSLPTDKPRAALQTEQGARFTQILSVSLSRALISLSASQQNSLFMWFMSAFMLFIGRINQQSSVLIGTPVLGRDHPQLEKLIGLFVNTLIIEAKIDPQQAFSQWQSAQQARILEALEYRSLPFDRVVELASDSRDLSHHPVVQILFSLTQGQETKLCLPGLEVVESSSKDTDPIAVKCDLELHVQHQDDELVLNWKYDRNLYEQETIAHWAQSFEVMLSGIVAAPHTSVGQLPLLNDVQKQAMLVRAHSQQAQWPRQASIVSLFEQQVDKFSNRIALTDTESTLSYAQLSQRVDKLAGGLQAHGLMPEQLVPVSLSRGVDMVVTLLAILKAGGAYVPIDPNYPVERIEYIVSDVGSDLLVCDRHTQGLFAHFEVACVSVESLLSMPSHPPFQPIPIRPQQLAYMIYTSGTTGKPKGVQIEHRHVVRLLHPEPSLFDFNEQDVWTMFHSFCFDFSVWEMYGALLFGGKLVMVKQDVYKDTTAFAQLLLSEQVTVLNQTPSAFYVLQSCIQTLLSQSAISPAVRYVIFGGEALQPNKVKPWNAMLPNCQLINMYGITETTVHVTFKRLNQEDLALGSSNIGQPIPTTTCYVLDSNQQLLPQGAIGELYVGGEGVGRGYWQRPELNSARFFEASLSAQHRERLYRSGDLVRMLPNGEMTYVGRIDDQVKVRGYRIELGEIENQLRRHDWIQEAVVLLNTKAQQGATIEAFVTEQQSAQFQNMTQEIKQFLKTTLPDFMLPRSVTRVAKIPLTGNGKVDKQQLLKLVEYVPLTTAFEAPKSDLEYLIANAFKQVLKCQQVGRQDDFFSLGGHSLLAVELMNFLQSHEQVSVSLKDIFQFPSVVSLSQWIAQAKLQTDAVEAVVIPKSSDTQKAQLSYAQQRLWTLDAIKVPQQDTALYHVPLLFEIEGRLDCQALERAWLQVVNRHEVLRTIYKESAHKEVVQQVLPIQQMPINVLDMNGASTSEVELAWLKMQRDDSQKSFELDRDLMVRVCLLKASPLHYKLLINIHHIACDAHSLRLIVKDLTQAYADILAGKSTRVSAPSTRKISYIDYANWQRTSLQGQTYERLCAFWQTQLADAPVVHQLPLDKARKKQAGQLGGQYVHLLNEQRAAQITAQCQSLGVSAFIWLHSLFSLCVARFSHCQDVVVGSPFSGRTIHQLDDVVGFFVNTLPIRMRFDEQMTWQELIAQQKSVILAVHQNQDMPFERIVDVLRQPRDLSHHQVFQISFAFDPKDDSMLELAGLKVTPAVKDQINAKFELDLSCSETDSGLKLNWVYNKALFEHATIECLAKAFDALVQSVLATPDQKVSMLPMTEQSQWQTAVIQGSRQALGTGSVVTQILGHRSDAAIWQRTALIDVDGREMSYQALDKASQHLAQTLLTSGVRTEDKVLLCLPSGIDWVVAMFAVMRISGCYVPLDPNYPEARIRHIAEDSGCKCVITYASFSSSLLPCIRSSQQLILLDDGSVASQSVTPNLPVLEIEKSHPAYVIYTSGTTGKPKGVVVPHQGLSNLCQWHQRVFKVDSHSVATQTASVAFDAATWEVWPYLCAGATLTFVSQTTYSDAQALTQCMNEFAVTHCFLATPIAMAVMSDKAFCPRDLAYLLVGGDKLSSIDVSRFDFKLVNNYGPTEAAVVATSGIVHGTFDAMPDIGGPIDNTQLFILDKHGQLQPRGAIGELYISGAGLALGYLNRTQLTDERFITWRAPDGEVMRAFRSGDLVRVRKDGSLAYLGRNDEQVKLRGYRIELDEITAQLQLVSEVEKCTVLTCLNANNNEQLVAFIVPSHGTPEQFCARHAQDQLGKVLPNYMLPSHYIALAALPLTAHGKIDKRALQALFESYSAAQNTAVSSVAHSPPTALQDQLLSLYRDVLNRAEFTAQCDFFAFGGDSILSIQLVSRARSLGVELSVSDIFNYPNVAKLSEHLAATVQPVEPNTQQIICSGFLEPLPAQQWFFEQAFSVPEHWNQAVMVSVDKTVKLAHIHQSVAGLTRLHDSLRLVIDDNLQSRALRFEPTIEPQRVADAVDISHVTNWHSELQIQCELVQQSLCFDGSPLLRVLHIETPTSEQSNRLMIVAHHLLIDGVSWRVLLEDLVQCLQASVNNQALPERSAQANLQQIATHFKHYAEQFGSNNTWLNCVKAANQQHFFAQSAASSGKGIAQLQLSLSQAQTQSLLTHANRPYNTDIQTLLLAALHFAVMQQYQVQSQVVMMEGHGRELLRDACKGSETLGWMTAIYPLHVFVNSNGLDDVICATKEALNSYQSKASEYGILRYMHPDKMCRDALQIDTRQLIFFNYLGQLDTVLSQHGLLGDATESCGTLNSANNHSYYAMQLTAAVNGSSLTINMDYDTTKLNMSQAEAFKGTLMQALEAIVTHCEEMISRRYTASDFPLLSACSQRQLNQLIEKYSDVGVADIYPLSHLQQGMWFQSQLSTSATPPYLEQSRMLFKGDFDCEAFVYAWQRAIEQHSILRSAFNTLDGQPVQVVLENGVLPVRIDDSLDIPDSEQKNYLDTVAEQEYQQGFTLTSAPCMRLRLLPMGQKSCGFVWTYHHMIMDGWSVPVLFSEILRFYRARLEGSNVPIALDNYADFIACLDTETPQSAIQFWQSYLHNADEPTLLSEHLSADAMAEDGEYKEQTLQLPQALCNQISRCSAKFGLTANHVIQSVFAYWLSVCCQSQYALFGQTIAGRPTELKNMESRVGAYINTQAVLVPIDVNMAVQDYLLACKENFAALTGFTQSALSEVQNCSKIDNGRDLFDVLYVFENFPQSPLGEQAQMPFEVAYRNEKDQTHYPLTLVVSGKEVLSLTACFQSHLFSDASATHFLAMLALLLEEVCKAPQQKLSQLPHVLPNERGADKSLLIPAAKIEVSGEKTEGSMPTHCSITKVFEKVAARYEHDDAVVFYDGTAKTPTQRLSYGTLNKKADQLAMWLSAQFASLSTQPIVGICIAPSADLIISILAVLKAGGAYLPITPSLPEARKRLIADNANAALILADKPIWQNEQASCETYMLSDIDSRQQSALTCMDAVSSPSDLCYVIYTSGTTGVPKGVMVEQKSVLNYVGFLSRQYKISNRDNYLQFASFSFDVFAEEVFCSLLNGATLVMSEQSRLLDVQMLSALSYLADLTLMSLPTAYWHQLSATSLKLNPQLRVITVGGEQMQVSVLRAWQNQQGERIRLINAYGPTETTISTTLQDVTAFKGNDIAIGRAVEGVKLHILDSNLKPLPDYVTGELYVSGEALARGYLGDAEKTARAFITDPDTGLRLYKTGDKVRLNSQHELVYIGRKDNQVKVRGYRIELAEVERQLLASEGVCQCAVVVRQDTSNHTQLVAFVELSGQHVSTNELLIQLKTQLPSYMVPHLIVSVEHLPQTTNGKLDRKALAQQALQQSAEQATYLAPTSVLQKSLARQFEALLKVEQVGLNDDFFLLGGHSLLVMRLVAEIELHLNISVPLATVIQNPSVGALASYIEDQRAAQRQSETQLRTLMCLQEGESGFTPVVLIAGAGGMLMAFQRLVEELDSRIPVYGLQPDEIADEPAVIGSVASTAAHYLQAMQAIQPVHLIGHSFGSFIGYEMARQATRGEIRSLTVIDTPLPTQPMHSVDEAQISQFMLDNLCEFFHLTPRQNEIAHYIQMAESTKLTILAEWLEQAGIYFSEAQLERFYQTYRAQLLAKVNVNAPLSKLPITVIKASKTAVFEGREIGLDMGWRRVVKDIKALEIDGDHLSILQNQEALNHLVVEIESNYILHK
ncbi:non-ribosomal peptide synthetase [Pseudoalteromonas luteoviolacea]|uniref:Carrier domain-containing protein n=1 Tax=Pseudoalteromonas luteoviolacea S4060-1 TaxID=1365257 RepID=A0A167NVW9_9GAMM|nr:non-ribosomal peptide synthetase [Pseudoalteromonas luteoviolacea]KZN68928.1 hypothetical protein N478_13470 [Pseudoalteromonas luteoviolacea S4060-1]